MSRIPPHATRVFKGVIFDVYQWPQEMFDGTVEMFEALRRPDAVNVIALDGEDVLYAKQEQPFAGSFLSFFGGRTDAGETQLAAAQRELREESGLVSDTWEHLWDEQTPGRIEWTASLFLARNCRKVGAPTPDSGERIEVLRAPLDSFFTTILPRSDFRAPEIKRRLFSALDQEALVALIRKLRGDMRGS